MFLPACLWYKKRVNGWSEEQHGLFGLEIVEDNKKSIEELHREINGGEIIIGISFRVSHNRIDNSVFGRVRRYPRRDSRGTEEINNWRKRKQALTERINPQRNEKIIGNIRS